MKIVVLAGGTSTERTVSITSGTGICKALRQKGHQAILVDIFCGVESVNWEDPFPAEYDVDAASEYMSTFNDKIEQMKKAGALSKMALRHVGAMVRPGVSTFELDDAAEKCVLGLSKRTHLTGRGIVRLVRIARTIADVAESEQVTQDHVLEAAMYQGRRDQ